MPSFPGNDISTDKLPEKNPNKAQIVLTGDKVVKPLRDHYFSEVIR